MALKSLGEIVVAASGTPVQVVSSRTGAQSFTVQAKHDNTGYIYVGRATMVIATLAGVYAIIGIPAATGAVPSYTASIPEAPEGFNLADIYLDASVSTDSALVSYTEQ